MGIGDSMASNVVNVRVVFNSNDMSKETLKLCIKLIRGVTEVIDLDVEEEVLYFGQLK